MSMQIKKIPEAIVCEGISIRTSNYKETRPETAKLGELWQNFYQTTYPQLPEDAEIYGIYHNYESDDAGEFDVVAGWHTDGVQEDVEESLSADIQGDEVLVDEQDEIVVDEESEVLLGQDRQEAVVSVTIPTGTYLVFSAQGKMPDIVVDAWEKIWAYFNDPECKRVRLYEVDFEHYVNADMDEEQVDIYIGIE